MALKKIPKTISRQIEDLKDHLFLLEHAIINVNNNRAFIKLISHELRMLLISFKGHPNPLLFRLAKEFNFELTYKSRIGYRPERFRNKKYLDHLIKDHVIINRNSYSIQKFIRVMANEGGGGSHEPEEVHEIIPYGESLIILGSPASHRLLLAEAKKTLEMGKELLTHIDNLKD